MLVSESKPTRWSVTEEERMTHESPDEAMEDYLDGYAFDGKSPDTPAAFREFLRDLGVVEVMGYAPMDVGPRDAATCAVESVSEWLEDNYGDQDGDYTLWSDETRAAALVLGKAVMRDFHVFMMEPITSVKINALEWVEKYAPEWLEAHRE